MGTAHQLLTDFNKDEALKRGRDRHVVEAAAACLFAGEDENGSLYSGGCKQRCRTADSPTTRYGRSEPTGSRCWSSPAPTPVNPLSRSAWPTAHPLGSSCFAWCPRRRAPARAGSAWAARSTNGCAASAFR